MNAQCPVCQTEGARPRWVVAGYPLFECAQCSLRFHRLPESPELYDARYFTGGAGGSHGYENYDGVPARRAAEFFAAISEDLTAVHPERGRLLEVGCATGALVAAAIDAGWDAMGIDVAEHAVRAGKARGLPIEVGTLDQCNFPPNTFDVIVSAHTIEHVSDPVALLAAMARVSKSGGTLVAEVPNSSSIEARALGRRWSQLKPPEHLVHFNRRSLTCALVRAGWRPLRFSTPTDARFVADDLATGRWTGRRAAGVVMALSRVGLFRLVERRGLGGALRVVSTRADRGRLSSTD